MAAAEIPKVFDRDINGYNLIANSAQEMLLKLGLTQRGLKADG